MLRLNWIIFLLQFAMMGYAQGIDYNPRGLKKALKKQGIVDWELKELLPIDSLKTRTFFGKFFELQSMRDNSNIQYIYIGRVNSCRAGGCSLPTNVIDGEDSEYFDYFMGFDHNKQVLFVQVFNYQATHGYEISSRGWLKQFAGHHQNEKLRVGKEIDAISGATISVNAITDDIREKTSLLEAF